MVDISFLWDGGGVNILWFNILTPLPLNDIKERQVKQKPITALLYHFDHL